MTVSAPVRPRIERAGANAAIYHGTVRHRRTLPAEREFTPKLFLSYVDVDALPESLDPIPLWSARRRAPMRFRRQDFFDGGVQPLGAAVRDLVEERLGRRPTGPVFLLAHLRTFGYLFNPLAVYYCWSPDRTGLDAIVLEVSNTPWGERCWYVFEARGAAPSARTAKEMHVSPFLPMDVDYHVSWSVPDEHLSLRIEVERGGLRIFDTQLSLRRAALDRRSALRFLTRSPLLPLRGWLAIHREAMRLFVARLPLYGHPGRSRGGVR